MGRCNVKLVKKIIQKAEIIIEHDGISSDDIADKAWAEFPAQSRKNVEYDYSTIIEVID